MDLEPLIDPELRPALLKQVPSEPPTDFVAEREAMQRNLAAMRASMTHRDDVRLVEAVTPGLPGVPVRVYEPADRPSRLPGFLWIHGGGFTRGSAAMNDPVCETTAAEVGCVVVSVDYRLAPEHPYPTPLDDCYAALAWLHASTEELGVDPARLAIGGQSAGGGLAAGLALLARDRGEVDLVFQLLLCACIDDRHETPSSRTVTDPRTWSRARSIEGWKAYLGTASGDDVPVYAAPNRARDVANLPPSYLSVSEHEVMRDENVDYASRLLEAGVSTELHVWPRTFHGFENFAPDALLTQQSKAASFAALRRALHP